MKKIAFIILVFMVFGIYYFRYIPKSYYKPVISDVYYYTDFNKESIPIPNGFIVDEENNIVENGLVIIDNTDTFTKGNEFVWVPCEKFERIDWDNNFLNFKNYNLNFIDEKEYLDIIESVNKYKGFYVARYESSKTDNYIDGVQIAASLPDKKPWNEISYATNMLDKYGLSNGALKSAKYTYKNIDNVNSTLLYSEHFDIIVNWLIESNVLDLKSTTISNSNNYISNTGQSSFLNIYDLFGNVWEWTTESYNGNYHIIRGGAYDNISIERRNNDAYTIDYNIGFRMVLII